jgi:hypothetical protein
MARFPLCRRERYWSLSHQRLQFFRQQRTRHDRRGVIKKAFPIVMVLPYAEELLRGLRAGVGALGARKRRARVS